VERNSPKGSALTASTALCVIGGEGCRRRLQLTALVENFDAALGLLELRMAEPRELDTPLVEGQRLLERQVTLLELLDDGLELGDGGFKVFDGRVGHYRDVPGVRCAGSADRTSQCSSPSDRVT